MKNKKSIGAILDITNKYENNIQMKIKELKKLISNGRKSGDIITVGAAYYYLAEAYRNFDDLRGLYINSLKAVTILKDTEEYELLIHSYLNLAETYLNQGNNQMSLICDESAYEIVKKHRITGELRITTLNNLSVSYHAMNEPAKSIVYLNDCIDLTKKEYPESYTDILMFSINLAGCYKDIGELNHAKEIFEDLEKIIDKVEFVPLVCDYYIRRAIVLYQLNDIDLGNKYIDKALEMFPSNTYLLPLYDDLCEVAKTITGNKDSLRSKKIFDLMTVYAKDNPGTLEQMFATKMIANYYKDFGEYELATEYFAKYADLNEKQMDELKEMQLKLHYATLSTEQEIRKLKRMMRKSEELLTLEPLTQLLNRSALLKVSTEFIESAAKKRQKIGAIFIDIDCFKECNDTYGHAKGDEIIKEVARACHKYDSNDVRFARYGGDEFFGISKGLTDDEVCEIARKIARTIRSLEIPNKHNPNGGILTLSIGVVNVAVSEKTDTILEIANYADKAVYYAKNAGKNVIYELVRGDAKTKNATASFIKIDF